MEWVKVLAVDHEQGGYETLKRGLAKHGYVMHTTATVPKALALAGAHRYQAAFVSLPLVCNTTFMPDLHAEYPDLPVIVVLPREYTDYLPQQVFKEATQVIGKPLLLEPVRVVLERTLELVALRAMVRRHRQAQCEALALRVSLNASGGTEDAPAVPFETALVSSLRHMVPNLEVLGRGSLHHAVLSYVEKLLLTIVLEECRGSQIRSAEILGINRNTLRKKIREFGLTLPRGGA